MIQQNIKKIQQYIFSRRMFDSVYLVILSLYLVRLFFDTTLFVLPWPKSYFDSIRLTIGIYLLIKIIVFDRKDFKVLFFDLAYLILFYFIYKGTGYLFLLELGFFVLAAKDIPYKRILKVYLAIGISIMTIAIFGALTGAVKDLIYVQDGMFKHAFGIVYTTDFGAHILFLVLAYLALKEKAPGALINILILFLAFILYRYSGTRNSAACMVLLVLGGLYINITDKILFKPELIRSQWKKVALKGIRVIDCLLVVSAPMIALLALIFTIFYSPDNAIINKINTILTNRLMLGNNAIKTFGYSLWGKPFDMIGAGGDVVFFREGYNFVDCSYAMIFVRYGVVLFCLTVLGFIWMSIKTTKNKKRHLLVIIFIMALQCVIEHHMLEMAYNFLTLLCFSKINNEDRLEHNETKDNLKKITPKYCIIILAICVFLLNVNKIISYTRTIVTLLNLNAAEKNVYFIIATFAMGIVCIITVFLLKKLFYTLETNKLKNVVWYLSGCIICLCIFAVGLIGSNNIIIDKSTQYKGTIVAGNIILKELDQIPKIKLYINDIPYLYMKEKQYSNIIPGNPYRKDIKSAVVITKSSSEMLNLIDNGYVCGKISEQEYIYTNDNVAKNIIQKNGVELLDYYAERQSIDLQNIAEANDLSIVDNGKILLEGPSKSLVHGPWITFYKGHIKVDYDLELLSTDVNEGAVAILRLSTNSGTKILKEVEVNKSDFNNGKFVASLDSFLDDSEGVEFLIFVNGNTKLKLNSLTYGKIGKE